MIYGKTFQEKQKERQNQLKSLCKIKKYFAYLPIQTNNGRMVWLQYYYYLTPILIDEQGVAEYNYLLQFNNTTFESEEEAKQSTLWEHWKKRGMVI
jgi:hypothetical protein